MNNDFELEEEKKENSERWLLTYSDMITLLLALFIILYSISVVDSAKFKKIAEGMGEALNNPKSSQTSNNVKGGSNTNKGNTSSVIVVENSLEKVAKELNAYIKSHNLNDQLNLTQSATQVKLTIKDSAFFAPDKAVLLPGSNKVLNNVAKVLKSVFDDIDHITISGHTANVGKDNIVAWQLSSDRALLVLGKFINYGLEQNKFSIEGNSHYKPAAPNTTEENLSKNRRVEIIVSKNDATSKTESTTEKTTEK